MQLRTRLCKIPASKKSCVGQQAFLQFELLYLQSLATVRIAGSPIQVSGICTSTNISALRIPPRQHSGLENTLGENKLHSQIIQEALQCSFHFAMMRS